MSNKIASSKGYFCIPDLDNKTSQKGGKSWRSCQLLKLVYGMPVRIGTAWLYFGLPIFAIALVISVATIFNAASTPIDKPVTEGIYRISRHPIYLSGFLMYTGIGIACASWVVLVCAVLWIVIWSILVLYEERFLIEKYGDSYREYLNGITR